MLFFEPKSALWRREETKHGRFDRWPYAERHSDDIKQRTPDYATLRRGMFLATAESPRSSPGKASSARMRGAPPQRVVAGQAADQLPHRVINPRLAEPAGEQVLDLLPVDVRDRVPWSHRWPSLPSVKGPGLPRLVIYCPHGLSHVAEVYSGRPHFSGGPTFQRGGSNYYPNRPFRAVSEHFGDSPGKAKKPRKLGFFRVFAGRRIIAI